MALKKEQKKLAKKAKLERIARQTKEAEKSLKKLKGGREKSKGQKILTAASLRGMDDVVEEVDRLMDKNLKIKKRVADVTDSSSSDSDSSSSSCGSNSSDDMERAKKKEKKERKVSGKHRSGKSKRLTSYVKYPQEWPHSHLSLHFVNKEKKFEELTLAEFCAGYSSILNTCSKATRAHRTTHLTELMYLATKYQWRCVLNYHAACLLEIERGHLEWGDSFQMLQSTTLAGGFLNGNHGGGSNTGKKEGTLFCVGYQRGTCQQARDHYGFFEGESRLLKHICAKCWRKSKKLASHPETSELCPSREES